MYAFYCNVNGPQKRRAAVYYIRGVVSLYVGGYSVGSSRAYANTYICKLRDDSGAVETSTAGDSLTTKMRACQTPAQWRGVLTYT